MSDTTGNNFGKLFRIIAFGVCILACVFVATVALVVLGNNLPPVPPLP